MRAAVGSGLVLAGVLLLLPGAAEAQFPPDSLKNLRVFPPETTPREIIGAMRGFATGLGVRCSYCHVGEEGQPLSTFDFASDEKVTKQRARVMFQMVQDINAVYLTRLPGLTHDHTTGQHTHLEVTCETCHRGQARPLTLAQTLLPVATAHGADSAVALYHALRRNYYGRATFDFGEWSLQEVGEALIQGNRARQAIPLLQLNAEQFPASAAAHATLGSGYEAAGDASQAVAHYRKALELNPRIPRLQQRIDSLAKR